MSGIKEFKILFDNRCRTYLAGERITGRIVLDLYSPKKCRGIKLKVKGEAATKWDKNGTGGKKASGNKQYFSSKFYIVGGESSELNLNPTRHILPFGYVLPLNLPSSFEWNKGETKAHIRYTIRAIIDIPYDIDVQIETAFTVISNYDLNTVPFACEPVFIEEEKTDCCFASSSSSLTVDLSLRYRGYVPGQMIPMKINIKNISRDGVRCIHLKLKMYAKFSSGLGLETKNTSITLIKAQIGRIENNTSLDRQFQVPPLPPSNLGTSCKIISYKYALELEVELDNIFSSNLKMSTPIVIGTVPLANHQLFGSSFIDLINSLTYEKYKIVVKKIQEEDEFTRTIEPFAPRYHFYHFPTF